MPGVGYDQTLCRDARVKKPITNLAASVYQKLLDLRSIRGEDFQLILNRYGLERFLFRLSKSAYADRFILKGAFLFIVWGSGVYRPTRDADFHSVVIATPDEIRDVFVEICRLDVAPDGLIFDPTSVTAAPIRARNDFGGIRVHLTAFLQRSRLPLQFDIGFGGIVSPKPRKRDFPALLPFPAPHISMYPREAMIAEKFHALVKLGRANSRMKDYYDIFQLSRSFSFDGKHLSRAIERTFLHEKTTLSVEIPIGLTSAFADDHSKMILWRNFLKLIGQEESRKSLNAIIEGMRIFLMPPVRATAEGKAYKKHWPAGGPWKDKH